MQLKKIKVYGRLKKFLGSSYFEAAVSSPSEAICFLLCNFPEVESHMANQYYKIKMNNLDVNLDFIQMKGKGDIQIIPIATGSGFLAPALGGFLSTGAAVVSAAAGAAVTAVSAVGSAAIAVGGAIAAEYGTTGIFGAITTATVNSLAIEGVTSLIAPTPVPFESGVGASEADGALDPQMANSYSFSGIQNVSVTGVSVPIIYGEVFTGSVVISSGVDTVQVEGTT